MRSIYDYLQAIIARKQRKGFDLLQAGKPFFLFSCRLGLQFVKDCLRNDDFGIFDGP